MAFIPFWRFPLLAFPFWRLDLSPFGVYPLFGRGPDGERQDAHKPPTPKGVSLFQEQPDSRQQAAASVDPRPGRATKSATEWLPDDPDLGAIIDAWPELPAAVKAGIVAMVKASPRKTSMPLID